MGDPGLVWGAGGGYFFPNLERRRRKYFKVVALGQLLGCAPFCEVSFLAHGQSQSNNPCSRLLLSSGPVWTPEICKGYEEQQTDFC